jgi:hypothetical protein
VCRLKEILISGALLHKIPRVDEDNVAQRNEGRLVKVVFCFPASLLNYFTIGPQSYRVVQDQVICPVHCNAAHTSILRSDPSFLTVQACPVLAGRQHPFGHPMYPGMGR